LQRDCTHQHIEEREDVEDVDAGLDHHDAHKEAHEKGHVEKDHHADRAHTRRHVVLRWVLHTQHSNQSNRAR
jgi:hypothetical protein